MSYDARFYDAYEKYLHEPAVRVAHDWVFSLIMGDPAFQYVIDLGCGASCEFKRFFKPIKYLGIDINSPDMPVDYRTLCLDYKAWYHDMEPAAFVSLFSSEITASAFDNRILYEDIFKGAPTIRAGLVSGFYYAGRKNQEQVKETGDIVSYQTLEAPEEVISTCYSEKRIILPVPSKMFGDDVYEVWKLLERK